MAAPVPAGVVEDAAAQDAHADPPDALADPLDALVDHAVVVLGADRLDVAANAGVERPDDLHYVVELPDGQADHVAVDWDEEAVRGVVGLDDPLGRGAVGGVALAEGAADLGVVADQGGGPGGVVVVRPDVEVDVEAGLGAVGGHPDEGVRRVGHHGTVDLAGRIFFV